MENPRITHHSYMYLIINLLRFFRKHIDTKAHNYHNSKIATKDRFLKFKAITKFRMQLIKNSIIYLE